MAPLSPLTQLPALEHLSLLGVVPEDRSLAPLKASGSLRTASFLGFPVDEIAGFFAGSFVQQGQIPRHELLPAR